MTRRSESRTVAIFGYGVVAPGARDLRAFRDVLDRGASALTPDPRAELGHGIFPVGDADFDPESVRAWITSRHGDPRYQQIRSKLGDNCLFAIGAFVQAIEANPTLEAALRESDLKTHVYIGSGVGDLAESYAAHESLTRATRIWNRFWSHESRCAALRAYRTEGAQPGGSAPPPDPSAFEPDSDERFEALCAWHAYWAERSNALTQFERAYAEVERTPVGEGEKGALHAIKARQRAHRKLIEDTGCPPPPWTSVDPRLIWAIQNVPAAQVAMLLGTHGPAWAPVGACATFGVALKCARDAIVRGEADAVVVGTTDPRPDPALLAAFHRARLAPATGAVNMPLTSLLGTHVAGGACVWVIADVDAMARRGVKPVGPVIESVALSEDAEHIITPSAEGPKNAIRQALGEAHVTPDTLAAWDLHATGTPGDLSELELSREFLGPRTAVSARKGLFGHGMANAGAWELTALALGLTEGRAFASGVEASGVHPALCAKYGDALVTDRGRALDGNFAVKVMLGVGGLTACVVLRAGP
jgi:3-oxoacyl-(acyl-carrier-protein) synthase